MKTNEKISVSGGMDLGTYSSVGAMIDANGVAVPMKNLEGKESTRSAVAFPPDGDPIVGQEALNVAPLYPNCIAREMKLHIGEQDRQGNDVAMILDTKGNPLTPAQAQAVVAKKLIDDINAQIPYPLTDIVITVPANYGNRERQAILGIEKRIGCRILALVEEPVAAACTFINTCKPADGYYLVFDMGAGTTDLTVLEISGATPRILVTKGQSNLGGRRCDMALIEVIGRIAKDSGIDIANAQDPATLYEFHEKVERAKITLTQAEKTLFFMNFEGKILKTDLLRSEFEKACAPILAELRDLVTTTIGEAKLTPEDIKGILPNGPSCLMPMIVNLLGNLLPGVPVRRETDPVTAVAQGAALMAAKYAQQDGRQSISKDGTEIRALDKVATVRAVATHGLGCQYLVNGKRDAKAFAVIISANTPLPATKSETFRLLEESQTEVDVEVLQGEEGMSINQCVPVAKVKLDGIPAGKTDVSRIVVQYAYSRSGIVEVTVTDTISKKSVSSNIEHNMGSV